MKTYNRSVLKRAVLTAAIALCFSLNLSAGIVPRSLPSTVALSDTGKMKKVDKMKKKEMKEMKKKKMDKMEKSKMEPSKMDADKMGSKM